MKAIWKTSPRRAAGDAPKAMQDASGADAQMAPVTEDAALQQVAADATQTEQHLTAPSQANGAENVLATDEGLLPEGEQTEPNRQALAGTLLKAVQERLQRAEKSVLRSMAEQNGMDAEALGALLQSARAEAVQAEAKPDARTAQLTQRLVAAELKSIGADLGLLDAEVALRLIDPETISVTEEGSVMGLREALMALKSSKGYLFKQTAGAWVRAG